MLAKYGLILMVVLATLLAFLAGTLLPDARPDGDAPGPATPAATAAQAENPAASTAVAGQGSKPDDPAVPYAELSLPNVLPDKAQLALQIGLFINPQQAAPVAARVQRLGQKTRLLTVSDPNGDRWQLLAAGPYDDLAQARTQRLALRRGLELGHPPAILLLPPGKKPSAKPAD